MKTIWTYIAGMRPPLSRAISAIGNPLLTIMGRVQCLRARQKGLSIRWCKAPRGVLINPGEDNNSCILYIHGGGFTYKAAPYHWRNAITYAAMTHCKVFMADYRLTPRHPYPAALDDVLAAYRWLTESAKELKINPSDIIIAGDSAGGCLAAELTARLAAEPPKALMLLYPVLDRRMQTASMKEFTRTPMWNSRLNAKMWEWYINDSQTYISPNEYGPEILKNFPPTYIETAARDCLRDEALEFAEKLRLLGIPTELNRTVGTVHGFDIDPGNPATPAALDTRVTWLLTNHNIHQNQVNKKAAPRGGCRLIH